MTLATAPTNFLLMLCTDQLVVLNRVSDVTDLGGSQDGYPPVSLLPDFGKEQERVEKLVRMGTTDEKYRTISGDIECASWPM